MIKVRFFLAGAVLLTGCRLVIGMDDVILVDGGDDAQAPLDAAATDGASPSDAGTDSFVPPPPPPDASACVGKVGGECLRCCKETYVDQTPKLERNLKENGCICGGAACTTECATSICAATQGAPNAGCGQCVDGVLKSVAPACQSGRAECRTGPQSGCLEVVACIDACK